MSVESHIFQPLSGTYTRKNLLHPSETKPGIAYMQHSYENPDGSRNVLFEPDPPPIGVRAPQRDVTISVTDAETG